MADTATTPAGPLSGPPDPEPIRRTLLRRLMDVVATPASSASVQDRAIAADLLLELLIESDTAAREMCARRLQDMSQAPRRLLRFLAGCAPSVARHILAENKGLDDSDLATAVQEGGPVHRAVIASRRDIGPSVTVAIAESGDPIAMEMLLNNTTARLGERAVDLIVRASREAPRLTTLLLQREELRPAHALAMFWWCAEGERRHILLRFSAERTQLLDSCGDVFRQIATGGVDDPNLLMALQVIERRQRDRKALVGAPFASLEALIEEAGRRGFDAELSEWLARLSGIKPVTGVRILKDPGGEAVSVLCKAVGLRRQWLRSLWMALGRSPAADDERWRRVSQLYESLAVAKAQTVLRYWDWRFVASYTPDEAAA
jgi:uncharacterized protein (DUF2336 family)